MGIHHMPVYGLPRLHHWLHQIRGNSLHSSSIDTNALFEHNVSTPIKLYLIGTGLGSLFGLASRYIKPVPKSFSKMIPYSVSQLFNLFDDIVVNIVNESS